MNHRVLSATVVVLLGGCAEISYKAIDPAKSVSMAPPAAITVPIGLVADTQFHESRGVPSRYFSLAGDEIVDVTIRSGQQVIGAGDILQFALQKSKQFPLVIHLGDAIDVSCQTEWSHFKHVMTEGRGPLPSPNTWLFAPGNHDGFLAGNIFPQSHGLYRDDYWSNLCNAGLMKDKHSNRYSFVAKHKIVTEYVTMLGETMASNGWSRGCNADRSLCWSAFASEKEPWRSLLLQRVLLPSVTEGKTPIYALLLDSSDYELRPYLDTFYAGVRGSISYMQMQEATKLVSELPLEAKYFFIAHHPASDWHAREWDVAKREAWGILVKDKRSLQFLISAHTHEGFLRANGKELADLIELNVGSLADAPVYMRSLEFHQDLSGRISFRSEGIRLRPDEKTCVQLQPQASKKGGEYGVDTQRSENARASELPPPIQYTAALVTATKYFINLWNAKHKELRPQLLAYADIVDKTMPDGATLSYVWSATNAGALEESLNGKAKVSSALRDRANCMTGVRKCSVQAKGNLLLAVEHYYWRDRSVPADVKEKAHEMRLCMAIAAAEESPTTVGARKVERIYGEVANAWSFRLTP